MKPWRTLVLTVAMSFPLGALSAQTDTLATHRVQHYSLGNYDPSRVDSLAALERGRLNDPTVEIIIVGYADATPYIKSCGNDSVCSDRHNMVLALQRSSEFARVLTEKYGVNPGRMMPQGQVAKVRGGEFRGVTVYLRRYTPPTAAPVVQQISTVSSDRRIDSLARDVNALRDSVARLAARPTSTTVVNQVAPAVQQVTQITEERASVHIGAGAAFVSGNSTSTFTPTLGIFVKPIGFPLELTLEGGFLPSRIESVCNSADVFGAIGAEWRPFDLVGISGGLFTGREMCVDGGPRLNERWVNQTNGLFLGPTFNFDLSQGFEISLSPSATWGRTHNAQTHIQKNGLGFQLRLGIRTQDRR